MFYSNELLSSKKPLGQIWILANVPKKAKINRSKAARLSVNESCDEIMEPPAPIALRLAAVLMRGVVQLYQRQITFLQEDSTSCANKLRSSLEDENDTEEIEGSSKNTLKGKKQARRESITHTQISIDPSSLGALGKSLNLGGGGGNPINLVLDGDDLTFLDSALLGGEGVDPNAQFTGDESERLRRMMAFDNDINLPVSGDASIGGARRTTGSGMSGDGVSGPEAEDDLPVGPVDARDLPVDAPDPSMLPQVDNLPPKGAATGEGIGGRKRKRARRTPELTVDRATRVSDETYQQWMQAENIGRHGTDAGAGGGATAMLNEIYAGPEGVCEELQVMLMLVQGNETGQHNAGEMERFRGATGQTPSTGGRFGAPAGERRSGDSGRLRNEMQATEISPGNLDNLSGDFGNSNDMSSGDLPDLPGVQASATLRNASDLRDKIFERAGNEEGVTLNGFARTENLSRRSAARAFVEMLGLASNGSVDLNQAQPYTDVEITIP